MRSAVNQVQFCVRIRFRRLFRIIRLDDAVRRAVDNQHPPVYGVISRKTSMCMTASG